MCDLEQLTVSNYLKLQSYCYLQSLQAMINKKALFLSSPLVWFKYSSILYGGSFYKCATLHKLNLIKMTNKDEFTLSLLFLAVTIITFILTIN